MHFWAFLLQTKIIIIISLHLHETIVRLRQNNLDISAFAPWLFSYVSYSNWGVHWPRNNTFILWKSKANLTTKNVKKDWSDDSIRNQWNMKHTFSKQFLSAADWKITSRIIKRKDTQEREREKERNVEWTFYDFYLFDS